ncbi:MAG: oligosaccharide flippase family protein [Thermoguttaceae bacterium]
MNEEKSTPLEAARAVLRSYMTDAGRTAARNLSWLAVLSVLAQLCSLGSTFFLLSEWGRDDFGVLGFALSIQAYLTIFGTLGTKRIVIREAAGRPHELDVVLTSHLVITAAASTLALVVTSIVVSILPMARTEQVLIAILALGNVAACVNIRGFFDVHHRQPTSAAISVASEVLGLAVVVGLAYVERLTLVNVGIVFAAKWSLSTTLHYLFYHLSIRPIQLVLSATNIRQMLASSWSLLLSGLVARTPLNAGVFFVRAFHTEGDVAFMFVAQRVARAYTTFTTIGDRILRPHIAGRYGMYASFVRKLAVFYAAFRGLIFVAALTAVSLVILWLPDTSYRLAIAPIAILMFSKLINGIGNLGTMYAVVLHRERIVLLSGICSSAVFVVGCLALVPQYTYNGAAVAAVFASLTSAALIVRAVRAAYLEKTGRLG